jgi:hypothetical protein
MIAANYRKFPEAMALQWPLPFGRALVWALKRPTQRILRKIRADRAAAFKAAGRIKYPEKKVTPAWFKAAKRTAKILAKKVEEACIKLDFENDGFQIFGHEKKLYKLFALFQELGA